MATDHIRYDLLVQDALRGVLRRVLTDAAAHGLAGEHHFFITFQSKAEGVKLSPRLLAQYPEEMTIILQHQFWDLLVSEDHFEVGLSFNEVPERVVVPFNAMKSFYDPSVPFHLHLRPVRGHRRDTGQKPARCPCAFSCAVPPPAAVEDTPEDPPKQPGDGAEVVRLDRFRKK